MSHSFVLQLFATLLWVASTSAHAVLVPQSPPPQSNLGLLGGQWRDSTLLMEALDLLKKGDRPAAKIKLAQFLKQNPKDPRGSELAGMLFMEDKNYPVAVLSFERSLALKPNNPQTLAKLGVALLLLDKKTEAHRGNSGREGDKGSSTMPRYGCRSLRPHLAIISPCQSVKCLIGRRLNLILQLSSGPAQGPGADCPTR